MGNTSNGGKPMVRDVMNYSPPMGPRNINDAKGPGLHGVNYGNCGTQCGQGGYAQSSGRPGLGGERMPNGGAQGRR